MTETSCLIGAHTSTAKGVYNALYEGKEIGANTIQFFTSNQRQWKGKIYGDEEVSKWFEAKKETGIHTVMSHASYLINLASPREEVYEKSMLAFSEELKRCHLLEVDYLNFHPGAALDKPKEEGLEKIVQSLLKLEPLIMEGKTRLLFEATAGQGSTLGASFEELGFLVSSLKDHLPIGVCIDTCHIFAAGYDIRSQSTWDKTLKNFNTHVGLKHLEALHVNDSLMDLASKRDRHAALGKGKIGLDAFRYMMENDKLKTLPKYLETPEGLNVWKKEISWLRSPTRNKTIP